MNNCLDVKETERPLDDDISVITSSRKTHLRYCEKLLTYTINKKKLF